MDENEKKGTEVSVKKPELPEGVIQIPLASGKIATVFPGTNKVWLKCLFGNESDIGGAYCQYAENFIEVDGQKLVQEDFEDMAPKEFAPLFIHLSSILF